MERRIFPLLLLGLLLVSMLSASGAQAARDTGPVVLVDLSHGEASTGLDTMFKVLPEFQWVVLVPSEEDANNLPLVVQVLAKEIWVGTLADVADMLGLVDGIIVGQPAAQFTPDEIAVLVDWFYSDSNKIKFIWLAGDSDYPAQGGNLEIAQSTINAILEELGAQLRHDYVSVEDPVNFAKRTYRVIGTVMPDEPLGFLAAGADAVLFHGPGALAYVDENGEWRSLSDSAPEGVFRIVWTSEEAYIVEHQPAQQGAPGSLGMAYTAGDVGRFVLMAAEIIPVTIEDSTVPRIILLSSETPYGGYQPMITYLYKGIPLDGPRFVRNVLLWASGTMGELKAFAELYIGFQALMDDLDAFKALTQDRMNRLETNLNQLSETVKGMQETLNTLQQEINALKQGQGDIQAVQQSIDQLQAQVKQLEQALADLQAKVGGQDDKIGQLSGQLDQILQQLDSISEAVEEAKTAAAQAPSGTTAMAGAVLGLIAIILAALALARKGA